MLAVGKASHFYSRNSAGKFPLDVREIGAAFLAGPALAWRVREFRDARLGRILAGETPVWMNTPWKVILHVVPLIENRQFELDVVALSNSPNEFRPLSIGPYGYGRLNIDGYVTCTSPIKEASYCYTQAFRSGEIEAVSEAPVNTPDQARREFYAIQIETDIVKGVAMYAKVLRDAGLIAPITVMLTIVGVRGCRVAFGGFDPPHREDITIDRDLLLLPDILLEPRDTDYARLLRPTFDVLWQASGFERSYGYDKDGNWDSKAHRS